MDLITLDFETYYDKDFSLRKLTTEEYVRDPRFEVVGVGVKVNNGPTEWASGTHNELQGYLDGFDWESSMVLLTTLCLTVLFCLGSLVLSLASGLILCVSLVLFTVSRLVGALRHLLIDMGWAKKGTKY